VIIAVSIVTELLTILILGTVRVFYSDYFVATDKDIMLMYFLTSSVLMLIMDFSTVFCKNAPCMTLGIISVIFYIVTGTIVYVMLKNIESIEKEVSV